jgi:hypothetical protein
VRRHKRANGRGRQERQPRPYGSLDIVFVRLRVVEVHEHTIAHVLGYEAAKRCTISATHFW